MFRKTFLIVFGVSSVLVISAFLGTWAAQMAGPYKAPMFGCDGPEVIPEDYMVCLKRGYSLKNHEETIGIDLSSSIEFTFPEDYLHGLIYCATLNDSTLEVVRNDTGVKFIECNRKLERPEARVLPAAVDL